MPQYLVTVVPRDVTSIGLRRQSLYLLAGPHLSASTVADLTAELLHDPVVQQATWLPLSVEALANESFETRSAGDYYLEIAYRPGVTDNEAESLLDVAQRLGLADLEQARSLRRYLPDGTLEPQAAARDLANELVQTTLVYRPGEGHATRHAFYTHLLLPPAPVSPAVTRVALRDAHDEDLLRISREGVLSLDLSEMRAIRDYFNVIGRAPTDGELETLAQTWSEHCSHKTFKARIRYHTGEQQFATSAVPAPTVYAAYHILRQDCEINSLIRTFLMAATDRVLAQRQAGAQPDDWVLSAFVDNAGIIAFTDAYEISFKVETHNHPSALEPFGGANTGVGGVVRDVLGVSARPIANTDVLCFGPPDLPAETMVSGVLHPRRICSGVVAGVRDYGNKLGIPTVNGAVLFDPGYTANPLVYCGTVGIAPRGAHPRNVQPGDVVVVLGGRTGRDGVHGATFSSAELTHTTATEVGSAVQIGDPITEKKLLDVLLQARDQGLYSAITDCGAGGLSSAVGEMGAETGVTVELAQVPLKYAGLQPWEIWLSESQERMVLAVPPQHLTAFLACCAAEDVEATPIGQFNDSRRLQVTYNGQPVVDLAMDFLHDGRPQRLLDAVWRPASSEPSATGHSGGPTVSTLTELLHALLAHPNIASKERIVRTYDHEVGGATVIKPLVGVTCDGPGDAAVLQPLRSTSAGLALGCGINPRYGRLDPYWMALACVDEAVRNVVAVGGDPGQTVILDNFCWGDPQKPDRLAGLVRAAAGCYDAAIAFGTPFISGKDSLNNEYRDANGQRVAIPPTLLISALAAIPDVGTAVTMDLKETGNRVYLVGATRAELGGAHVWDCGLTNVEGATMCVPEFRHLQSTVPQVDLEAARMAFARMHSAIQRGLVQSCHDLSEGGLAVAAAEMAFAGGLGLQLDLRSMSIPFQTQHTLINNAIRLFAETPSRFLVEVRPQDGSAFEATLGGGVAVPIGQVSDTGELHIVDGETTVVRANLAALKAAWQSGLAAISVE